MSIHPARTAPSPHPAAPGRGLAQIPMDVIVLVMLVTAGQITGLVDTGLRTALLGVTVPLLNLLGVVYSLLAVRRSTHHAAWALSAAARACAVLTAVGLIAAAGNQHAGWWWLATLSRLAMFALLSVTGLFTPVRHLRGRQRAAYLAEIVTVLGSGFMMVWYFALNPILAGHHPTTLWLSSVGYPIGDLLLFTAVSAILLSGAVTRPGDPVSVLVAGMALYAVGDITWSAIQAHGGRPAESIIAGACMAYATLLLTVAAMLASHGRRSTFQRPDGPPLWSTHLPLAVLGAGTVLLVIVTVRENQFFPWGGLVLGLIVTTTAVSIRQAISLRDSRDQITADALTGLANRTGLDNAITKAARRDDQMAVLLIDLDGFKLVNDAYGHAAGDTLLTAFAHHLRATIRNADLAARIGGDEFVLLITGITGAEQATTVAHRVLAAAAAGPVRLGDDTIPVRASIGIAVSQADDTPKTLLYRADVAMYHAKRAGLHSHCLYESSMVDRRVEDAALSDELDGALDRGEFRVLYQPLVDLTDARPIAAEALIRWHHPTRGVVSPVRFIPLAERSGAISAIGLWVLEQACRQIHDWNTARPETPLRYVSVNLAPRQLQEPTLIHDILAVLHRTGTAAHHLVLEVTESAIVDEHGLDALRALRSHGIRIAIDDFGTGYSSLHYLTRLPVDILKIDRSFINELNGTAEGAAITEAVIRLAQVLHLSTVAEGIETRDQAGELQALGCDIGQGYLFAKPLAPGDFEKVMAAQPG